MAERKGKANLHSTSSRPTECFCSSQQVLPAGLRPVPYPEEEGRKELAAGRPSHGSFFNVRRAYVCIQPPLTPSQAM